MMWPGWLRRRWPLRKAHDANWDLTALLNAADPNAPQPEQHLWLVRLVQWLRSPAPARHALTAAAESPPAPSLDTAPDPSPWPARRLRHLVQLIERQPTHGQPIAALLHQVLGRTEVVTLLAEHGFAPRTGFASEVADRLRLALVPRTPQTDELGELFALVFREAHDADWIAALDDDTLQRLALQVFTPGLAERWRQAVLDAIELLASQVRAAGLSPQLRLRIDPALLAQRPFHALAHGAQRLAELVEAGGVDTLLQQVQYLRALLDRCGQAADSVHEHLEAYGVSVDVVFQVDQVRARCVRIEALLTVLVSPQPAADWRWLAVQLVRAGHARRSWRALFARQYSLLARKVAERSAETGEHYITRTRPEYRDMLARAAGGGLVIGATTLFKFAIAALGFTAFWGGFWAGVNYAGSFVAIHLLHWTVATKQPAMTAPAMAAKLRGVDASDTAVEEFVDEVTHLIRSQIAGIAGNLIGVVPVVLAAQGLAWWLLGQPLISEKEAHHVLHSLSLLGATPLYAAFTGVLLFASSLIAGWVENSFVWHRLDSAIAWHPRTRAWLGPARAQHWALWWRANISGLAANVSLGLLLGLVPAVAAFFGLPLEVRHVTLATGQIAAALGTLGPALWHEPAFWWCVAAIPVTGAFNLLVSFALALRVALRSRGVTVRDRSRIARALGRRLWAAPMSFLAPPRPR
ncbi:MAG: site-specific recombinase [Burkholderiales bacterium]